MLVSAVLFALLATVAACRKTEAEAPDTKTAFLLDTVVSVTVYRSADQPAADRAIELCRSYERVFSRTDPESELYRLNHSGGQPVTVSEPLYDVLSTAVEYAVRYPEAFDITLGGVSSLYGFGTDDPHVPEEDALNDALSHSGIEKIVLGDHHTVTVLDPSLTIDLGAIAKGYIADQMKALLVKERVGSAIIDLGGNILVVGSKPDGNAYKVGIRSPFDTSKLVKTVQARDCSVVTSGDYERCFTVDGVTYHHILDPSTGRPARNGLRSVTVISSSSMKADLFSTLLFAAGPDAIPGIVSEHPDLTVWLVFDDGTLKSFGTSD